MLSLDELKKSIHLKIMFGLILLFVVPMLIGLGAKLVLDNRYNHYSRVPSQGRITGAEAAHAVMRHAGIDDVDIVEVGGHLTDHYDPNNKRLALSSQNYRGYSLAALGVAAHEAGHAIQHQQGYQPLKARAALVPITGFATNIINYIFLASLFFHIAGLAKIAVICFLVLAVFQILTLPVEFDASKRAREQLLATGILTNNEIPGVTKTLNAAGLTYVAALAATLSQLLYFFLASRD